MWGTAILRERRTGRRTIFVRVIAALSRRTDGFLRFIGFFVYIGKNYVLAYLYYVSYGYKYVLSGKTETFPSRYEIPLYLVFRIKKDNVAHPAEMFAVRNGYYFKLFNFIER